MNTDRTPCCLSHFPSLEAQFKRENRDSFVVKLGASPDQIEILLFNAEHFLVDHFIVCLVIALTSTDNVKDV